MHNLAHMTANTVDKAEREHDAAGFWSHSVDGDRISMVVILGVSSPGKRNVRLEVVIAIPGYAVGKSSRLPEDSGASVTTIPWPFTPPLSLQPQVATAHRMRFPMRNRWQPRPPGKSKL